MQVVVFEVPHVLILASTSKYRRELLGRVTREFSCVAPDVEETRADAESAWDMVIRLARAKADAVAIRRAEDWVIGSDQAAVFLDDMHREITLGKPGTATNCVDQLLACSGRQVRYQTAVAVLRHRDGACFEFVDTTRVNFRVLDRASVQRYVEREAPLDCAGGFKSEGLGITLCESIDTSDPTALIGLPLIRLCAVLRGVGFDLP